MDFEHGEGDVGLLCRRPCVTAMKAIVISGDFRRQLSTPAQQLDRSPSRPSIPGELLKALDTLQRPGGLRPLGLG